MCINKIRQNIMKNAKGASLNYVDRIFEIFDPPPLLTSVDIWRTLPPSLRWQEGLSKKHLDKNYFEEF